MGLKFKYEIDKTRFLYLHPMVIAIIADVTYYVKQEYDYDLLVTSTVSTKKEDDKLDLSKFKPKNLPEEAIFKVVEKLEKEKDVENFGDDGKLRYKPIFAALNGEVSYDEIRATMLFRV